VADAANFGFRSSTILLKAKRHKVVFEFRGAEKYQGLTVSKMYGTDVRFGCSCRCLLSRPWQLHRLQVRTHNRPSKRSAQDPLRVDSREDVRVVGRIIGCAVLASWSRGDPPQSGTSTGQSLLQPAVASSHHGGMASSKRH